MLALARAALWLVFGLTVRSLCEACATSDLCK
jgi:hypothetical protein